ncbi:MAG: type I-E CRISPR-associated protein Cas7/Cse4/CasC [Thermomicrobiales bacterium]
MITLHPDPHADLVSRPRCSTATTWASPSASPFGGATRTRISSQCLKRHWRTFDGAHALSELAARCRVRSRHHLRAARSSSRSCAEGVDPALARAVTEAIDRRWCSGESAKAKKAKDDAEAKKPKAKGKKGAERDDDAAARSVVAEKAPCRRAGDRAGAARDRVLPRPRAGGLRGEARRRARSPTR